jgi:hypothetical protein
MPTDMVIRRSPLYQSQKSPISHPATPAKRQTSGDGRQQTPEGRRGHGHGLTRASIATLILSDVILVDRSLLQPIAELLT